jgi:hypothetical protein
VSIKAGPFLQMHNHFFEMLNTALLPGTSSAGRLKLFFFVARKRLGSITQVQSFFEEGHSDYVSHPA